MSKKRTPSRSKTTSVEVEVEVEVIPPGGRIIYDRTRHCGARESQPGEDLRLCLALKGQGTSHPGTGYCSLHEDQAGYYDRIKRNRLGDLIQRAREMGQDPTNIVFELESLRAMVQIYLEDHADMDDPTSLAAASDLIDKTIRAASTWRKMQQEETIHLKVMELIHREMANRMILTVRKMVLDSKEADRLIEELKNQWAGISVETNPREAMRQLAERSGNEET